MKKILFVFFIMSISAWAYTNVSDFNSLWDGGGYPDGTAQNPDEHCTNYLSDRFSWGSPTIDSSVYFTGGKAEKVMYSNRNNFGNYSISLTSFNNGLGGNFSAYDYIMVYVKGNGMQGDGLHLDLMADNNGNGSADDDVWDHQIYSVLNKTNWLQVLIPLKVASDGFMNVSKSWNTVCSTDYIPISTNYLWATNITDISFAIESPVASPSVPGVGTVWFDTLLCLKSSELIYTSNPQPISGMAVTNVYQPISLDIGANKSNVRMIVNDVEYKTNDSHLTYDGNTVTFIPTEPFSEVVNVYVDAIDTAIGVPIVAKKWWFFIGQDTKSDSHLIKNLKISPYYKAGTPFDIEAYLSAEGKLDVSVYGLSGNKIGSIKSYDNLFGNINFSWDGKVNGQELSVGLYLIEFKYVSTDGTTQRRRVKTIQIIR